MRINVNESNISISSNRKRTSVNTTIGGGVVNYILEGMRSVAEISDLANLVGVQNEEVVFVFNRYRGGHFLYDSTDSTTADNGGTVFVFGGKRWKRIFDSKDGFNLAWWAGAPYNYVGQIPDKTTEIQNWVYSAMRFSVATGERPDMIYPQGLYFQSAKINWTTDPLSPATVHSGWSIYGTQTSSIIAVIPGTTISGAMWDFNKNSSSLSRHNIIWNMFFFHDGASFGRCDNACDFSYNNRSGMYNCRTSRISNETDIVLHFAYEFLFSQCNFSGSRSLGIPSNGVHLSDEANAIVFIGCSIDNYIGNGVDFDPIGGVAVTDPDYIAGAGIIFEGSKGLTIDTLTAQQCYYGVLIGSQARSWTITGGGYFEGNRIADIGLGNGGAGASYVGRIEGGAIKSAGDVVHLTNGIRFNGLSVHGLTVQDAFLDNADAVMVVARTNQVLNDIIFNNVRTGDTVYSFRNLIEVGASMYMDNIKVINPGSPMGQSATFVPIRCDEFTDYTSDFNTWTKIDGTPLDNALVQNGTWMGSPVWEKQNANIESITFILNDVNGLQNQILTFSCWISYNGDINANDLLRSTNQDATLISNNRPLKPSDVSTTGTFVKVHLYIKVGGEFVNDTQVKVTVFTRTNGLKLAKPELKLGFV